MKPTIGRIVHFSHGYGDPLAAIITKVWSDVCVNLVIFGDITAPAMEITSVMLSETPQDRTWNWPPKV